ncbi:MAG TPA: NAD(P)-dependent oxidoreductase [Alphaproteobacteria bacterium]|nr:NAD(P)-dependent oxidoreductase [Alphaproteobacteria bacterium]
MPTTNPIQRVGFIGLGNMGGPMAGHLAQAGFEMTVADISPGVASKFVARNGGTVAASLSSLGGTVEAVITMLPTGLIVRDVLVGGVLEGLAPGSIVIDMSTSNPFDTRKTAKQVQARGVFMIDCAVAGGVVFAKDATLTMTAGGVTHVLERCRPLLETMGSEVIHCGTIGAGHAMKALNNFINANALITAFEALSLGKRFGLDTETMLQSMTAAATGRNNPIEKKVKPHVADSSFTTGMVLAFLAKDVRIVAEMADTLESFAPIAKQCSALWTEAAERFGATSDQIEVARLWLKDT